MVIGIGVDIVQVDRMQKASEKQRFLCRVFTERERAYAASRSIPEESYAGMFAAKEAAAKALGSGFSGFGPDAVEILHDASGAPSLELHGAAKNRAETLGVENAFVSIAHDGGLAMAEVILEGSHAKSV